MDDVSVDENKKSLDGDLFGLFFEGPSFSLSADVETIFLQQHKKAY